MVPICMSVLFGKIKIDISPHRYQFTCNAYTVSQHFIFVHVLHPNTPSANSTSSTNSSHPTQGQYPSLGVSPSCAIQGTSPFILFSGCPPSQHTKYRFKPPNTRMIPFLRHISFLCFLGCFTKLRPLHSHTPPQHLEVILFTESPTLVTVLSMCAERVLTKMSYIQASPECIVVPRWPSGKARQLSTTTSITTSSW